MATPPTPKSARVLISNLIEKEIEVSNKDKAWALNQVSPEHGWKIIENGPKKLRGSLKYSTTTWHIVAQKYLPPRGKASHQI